jgi:rhamnosyl/mannosyltransferase
VALAEASQRLLYESGLRNRLVKTSRKRAEYFNHITMAQRSFEFYEQVLNQEHSYAVIPKPVDL